MQKVLVLGVGNVLLSDEGLGVHAIEYMKQLDMPGYIDLLDGGTSGFHLLSLFEEYRKVIIIDATLDGNPAGHIKVICPGFSNDFPRTLTTHDIGLKDLIDAASVLGIAPEIILITVTIEPGQALGLQLSPVINDVLPEIHLRVLEAATYLKGKLIAEEFWQTVFKYINCNSS